MAAEQRVTDDVLDHWASEAAKEPPGELGSINLPAVVEMLIAELRASRAREAEQIAEIRVMEIAVEAKRRKADEDFDARLRAEAERDVLQQRIDKIRALAEAARVLVPNAGYTGVGWRAVLDVLDASP